MKKSLKITLIVVGLIVLLIGIDITWIFAKRKPLIFISKIWANSNKTVAIGYSGILYNSYVCNSYTDPQIKAKWTKFDCSTFNKPTGSNSSSWLNNEETKDVKEVTVDELNLDMEKINTFTLNEINKLSIFYMINNFEFNDTINDEKPTYYINLVKDNETITYSVIKYGDNYHIMLNDKEAILSSTQNNKLNNILKNHNNN